MTSSRLPGKPLLDIGGQPLIAHVLQRARRVVGCDAAVLATTDRAVDQPLVKFASAEGFEVFCGPHEDVVSRFLQCADHYQASFCIRANGDSPFLDPGLISDGVKQLTDNTDLVTNLIRRTYPYGVAVEIISVSALRRARQRFEADDREHVSSYFYRHRERFNIVQINDSPTDQSKVRLTVDTEDDAQKMRLLFDRLGPSGASADVETICKAYHEEFERK